MQVITLDPKRTHLNNPDCPMRLVLNPDTKTWYCLDCRLAILYTSVEVMPVEESHER